MENYTFTEILRLFKIIICNNFGCNWIKTGSKYYCSRCGKLTVTVRSRK